MKRSMRPLTVDHERSSLGNEIDKGEVAHFRFARFTMIHGEGAQHSTATGENWDRPAGAKAVRQGDRLILCPQRVIGDV